MLALTKPSTATAFPLRLRLHFKAARVGGVSCTKNKLLFYVSMTIDFYGRYYERSENADHPYHLEGIDRSELKHLICDSKPIGFPWKEATIVRSSMEAKMELILISSEQGYFIIQCGEKDKFVLWDETLIREIIRPDDIEFPLGLSLIHI